ncbi:MAG: AarF/UbiB family protein, partial [Bdellovibrionota bacterium]
MLALRDKGEVKLFQKTRSLVAATVRSQQIVFVFSRYAVWEGLFALGLEMGKRGLAFTRPRRANIPLDAVFGKKLALALYRLGPTFVKLGQMLALRPDLIGDPVASELRVLFDQVPPVRFGVIKRILKEELGKKVVADSFSKIEPKPLGCASLAQVHQAELKDGTPVILKVQKRGAAKLVRVDLSLLEGLAKSADLAFPRYGIRQMYEDFYHATIREVDYREEAKNIEQFRKNYYSFFSSAEVIFPRYYSELST